MSRQTGTTRGLALITGSLDDRVSGLGLGAND
jgi:hypothetical protein